MPETLSKTTRAAAPGGVTAGGPRPGLALLVLAAAQLMVVLDATIVNVGAGMKQPVLMAVGWYSSIPRGTRVV